VMSIVRFLERGRAGVALVVWLGSVAPLVAQPTLLPEGWSSGVALVEPTDLNPDPHILEINVTARVAEVELGDTRVEAWTYDGLLPGPFIRLQVGDRLIVHLKNELPQSTTIHWHGVRVPFEMDGVPDITQPPVEPGGTFVYDFIVPDAGLFWYHPHVMSAAQVGFGLYGALLVEDPAERALTGVGDELVLVLSDIGVGVDGHLEPPDSGGNAGSVFGREGNLVLLNGRIRPHISVRAGVPQRWRIVNTAKSRYFTLYLDRLPFTVIGTDGGFQEHSVTSEVVVISPGERFDVIVTPNGERGSELVLRSLLYNRGYGSVEYRAVETLVTLDITGEPPYEAPALPEVARAIAPLDVTGVKLVDIDLTLERTGQESWEFGLNGIPFSEATPYLAMLGETQLWNMRNMTEWAHPMHLHGFFFQVVDENNAPVHPIAWKDTVNVPMNGNVRVAVHFDENRPGEWMYHCHILDHAEIGMMGTVLVGDEKSTEDGGGGASDDRQTPPRQ